MKLDELISATESASNRLSDIENLNEHELKALHQPGSAYVVSIFVGLGLSQRLAPPSEQLADVLGARCRALAALHKSDA